MVFSTERQQNIIHDIHAGLWVMIAELSQWLPIGDEKLRTKRFQIDFSDVSDFVSRCEQCQKHKALPKAHSQTLQKSIPVPFEVM